MLVSVMLFLTKDDLANLTLRDESRLFVLDNSFWSNGQSATLVNEFRVLERTSLNDTHNGQHGLF